MASIAIDTDAAREFLEALAERFDADEFEQLMSGSSKPVHDPERCIARATIGHLLLNLTLRDVDEMSALDQLRFRNDLDEMMRKWSPLLAEGVAGNV